MPLARANQPGPADPDRPHPGSTRQQTPRPATSTHNRRPASSSAPHRTGHSQDEPRPRPTPPLRPPAPHPHIEDGTYVRQHWPDSWARKLLWHNKCATWRITNACVTAPLWTGANSTEMRSEEREKKESPHTAA